MLPQIDISSLLHMEDADSAALAARRIDEACNHFGFFYAVGHGIAHETFERLLNASTRFFDLADTAKAEIAMSKGGIAWRGWFPVGGELTSGQPDLKEGLYFGEELGPDDPRVNAGVPLHGANLWPAAVPELRPAVEEWLVSAIKASEAIMRGAALALGLNADHFAKGLTLHPTLLFRIFHYPTPMDVSADKTTEDFGVGEHSDYGLLTLLAQDDKGGLEVRTPSGWIDVPPRGDALVVNIGDMFERLTRGHFRSAPHRVVNRAGASRYSFPLFFDPDFSASVEPLPIVVADRAEARWDAIDPHAPIATYGDYLIGKVSKVFPDLARGKLAGAGQ